MPQTRKAFLVKVGNITLGVVTKNYPTKSEIKLQLKYARHQEQEKVRLANSGWRKYENIKKEQNQIEEEFMFAFENINKNNYTVKFLQEV